MKNVFIFFLLFLISACSSNISSKNHTNKNNTVTEFLNDISSLEKDTNSNPIVTFKEIANKIADDKIVFNKKNIKEVLIKSRDYSNCVIITANHTIVKIKSLDDCQNSGSWKVCMPYVNGYVKRGKLNYKSDYMNNVIGIPDEQQRIAYFFINDKPSEKVRYLSYYENGSLKVKGQGFEKFNRVLASSKDGVSLMESADLNSKKIAKIPFGTEVFVKNKLEKWLNITSEFYLNPGDDGYFVDLIEPSILEGYVLDEFFEIKQDSIKKPGVWTYYYESGIKKKEEFHYQGKLIKKIDYDVDGDIIRIEEYRNDEFWGGQINVTYYKNGKIKSKSDADGGGAVLINFDENGDVIEDEYGSGNMKNHFDDIILSKHIEEFYLIENKQLNK